MPCLKCTFSHQSKGITKKIERHERKRGNKETKKKDNEERDKEHLNGDSDNKS